MQIIVIDFFYLFLFTLFSNIRYLPFLIIIMLIFFFFDHTLLYLFLIFISITKIKWNSIQDIPPNNLILILIIMKKTIFRRTIWILNSENIRYFKYIIKKNSRSPIFCLIYHLLIILLCKSTLIKQKIIFW